MTVRELIHKLANIPLDYWDATVYAGTDALGDFLELGEVSVDHDSRRIEKVIVNLNVERGACVHMCEE